MAAQSNFQCAVLVWQKRPDFRCVWSVWASWTNWKLAVYRLAANKLHGIRSVHRLVYSPIQTPASSANWRHPPILLTEQLYSERLKLKTQKSAQHHLRFFSHCPIRRIWSYVNYIWPCKIINLTKSFKWSLIWNNISVKTDLHIFDAHTLLLGQNAEVVGDHIPPLHLGGCLWTEEIHSRAQTFQWHKICHLKLNKSMFLIQKVININVGRSLCCKLSAIDLVSW